MAVKGLQRRRTVSEILTERGEPTEGRGFAAGFLGAGHAAEAGHDIAERFFRGRTGGGLLAHPHGDVKGELLLEFLFQFSAAQG